MTRAARAAQFQRDKVHVLERERHAKFRDQQRPLAPEARPQPVAEQPRPQLPRRTLADVVALRTMRRALTRTRLLAVMQRAKGEPK